MEVADKREKGLFVIAFLLSTELTDVLMGEPCDMPACLSGAWHCFKMVHYFS